MRLMTLFAKLYALCDVKYSQLEGHGRQFRHMCRAQQYRHQLDFLRVHAPSANLWCWLVKNNFDSHRAGLIVNTKCQILFRPKWKFAFEQIELAGQFRHKTGKKFQPKSSASHAAALR